MKTIGKSYNTFWEHKMNERLQELAVQAKELAEQAFREDGVKRFTTMEKFAELIVQECISCCDEVGRINQYHIEKDFIDPELGPKECIEVIKKHFGVEE